MTYLAVYICNISRQQGIQVEGYKQKRGDKTNKLSYQRTVSVSITITQEKKKSWIFFVQSEG